MIPEIFPVDTSLEKELQHKIDYKTKPLGALGELEKIALKIGLIQSSLSPQLSKPHMLVFAGDHGAAADGLSAYPPEVTYQMVLNFLNGGAAINVFCDQHDLDLSIVDAGVNGDFEPHQKLINRKIAYGTNSFIIDKAMTRTQCEKALTSGIQLVDEVKNNGTNIIGFGEMGIGNTSSASLLMSCFCDLPIAECVGRGTGLSDEQLEQKVVKLKAALSNHKIDNSDAFEVLAAFGGFEIVMMAGAMLSAASLKMIIMVDGFIASSAMLAAAAFNKNVLDYAIFCHESEEKGHRKMLNYMNAEGLLKLNLRLGEGTGCALAYPLVKSAVGFLNNMASFETAAVSNKE